MRITEVWFGTVLCLSCFGKALGELPAEETEGEDPGESNSVLSMVKFSSRCIIELPQMFFLKYFECSHDDF